MSEIPKSLIGLSGYARSGKDSVADLTGFQKRSFAAPLKQAVYALDPIIDIDYDLGNVFRVQELVDEYGWDEVKVGIPEARRLLQRMGTEVGRTLWGEDFWVERALADLRLGDKVVLADARFVNEAEAIRRLGGQVWRVERPGVGPVTSHPSETALDGYNFDRVIVNDGTLEDLERVVRFALKESGL